MSQKLKPKKARVAAIALATAIGIGGALAGAPGAGAAVEAPCGLSVRALHVANAYPNPNPYRQPYSYSVANCHYYGVNRALRFTDGTVGACRYYPPRSTYWNVSTNRYPTQLLTCHPTRT